MNKKKTNSFESTLLQKDISLSASKAQRRMIQISEAAIKNYATIGYSGTTYEKIAETAKISRPLIRHYFDTREEIFDFSIRYIGSNFQHIATQNIENGKTYKEKLEQYIQTTFQWVESNPHHSKAWLYYLHVCAYDPQSKKDNSKYIETEHQRLQTLLERGKKNGEFHFKDKSVLAKRIQIIMTGALVSLLSETPSIEKMKFKREITQMCLTLLH